MFPILCPRAFALSGSKKLDSCQTFRDAERLGKIEIVKSSFKLLYWRSKFKTLHPSWIIEIGSLQNHKNWRDDGSASFSQSTVWIKIVILKSYFRRKMPVWMSQLSWKLEYFWKHKIYQKYFLILMWSETCKKTIETLVFFLSSANGLFKVTVF